MAFDLDKIGRWTEERTFVVGAEQTIAYAAATNDTLEPHLRGKIAPPMFAVVPALMDVATAASASVWISEVEGYDTRSVHGEHDLTVNEPILPGMTLRSRAAVVGVQPKSSGTLLLTRTETRDENDTLLNTMVFVNFLREIQIDQAVGVEAPRLAPPQAVEGSDPFATIAYRVDADQSYRYAEASGDYGSYHIHDEAARGAGFPGVIVHGLCTMAFAARAVVEACCADDSRRLKRLGVRFTQPLLPNQQITTRIYRGGESEGRCVYSLEVDDAAGQGVIRRGIAEVRE